MALPKGVKSPVDYTKLYMSNELEGELIEKTMTSAQKRKDTMLKKKYDDSDMKKNMIAQYGKEEGTKIYFAKIRKEAMKEDISDEALTIQDWNVDDIKFTEIETVDIIKAKPLKESKVKIIGKGLKALGKVVKKKGLFTNLSKNTKIKPLSPKSVATPGTTYATGGRFSYGAFDDAAGRINYAGAPPKPIKTIYNYDPQGINLKKDAFKGGGLLKGRIDPDFGERIPVKDYIDKMKRRGKKYYEPVKGAQFGDKIMATKGSPSTPLKQEKLPYPKPLKDHFDWREELGEDWNKDDIKFTEIETVDIIKAKPLKDAELYEGFKTRMIAKFGKKLIKNIGKVNPFTKTGAQRVTGDVIKKTTPKIKGAFDVTGTQAAQMQRSKGGIKFPVRDATSKQISKNIQTKSIINQTKKANELGMKKLSNMKGSSGKDLSKPVKVNLSKPIDFDKYIGGQKPPVKKIYGTKKPTGTFTDDLPPVKTVPLNKSQTDLMKKLGKPKKKITKKKLTQQQQQQQAQKGKEKPKTDKPLQDHYDWREELGEDWQKVNRKDKTDGMSKAAVKAYRRENPGSKLKTAVTKDPKKLKKGSKSAKRRLAFCRRMKGMKKKLTSAKTSRDPNSRINKALRRWNC